MTAVLVFVGAMVGAPLRYLVSRAFPMPWGTFVVNIAGSFILGVLAGAASGSPAYALAGTGFCGALTTYSTFSYETLQLIERKNYMRAALNLVLSVVLGLGAAALGFWVG
ncbi:CrcB protein [Kibdelosporangium banguiense]|uniref:Fluoride-specific ion channel FluC n=1 Tax=Kibdelosporangium banguiense TaxID=1365924 RepID=A0ABS4T6L1_9PSEU|nr:fluoride efflux transporter CrcB [Kibdelosporangium banguiense]MBP2320062.1 CrcB protein [Kibdelosporangium banguiense]